MGRSRGRQAGASDTVTFRSDDSFRRSMHNATNAPVCAYPGSVRRLPATRLMQVATRRAFARSDVRIRIE